MGHVTFLLLFLPVFKYHNRKGMAHSSQGGKTKLPCLAVLCALLKNRACICYLKNSNGFEFSRPKAIFPSKISVKKPDALPKIAEKMLAYCHCGKPQTQFSPGPGCFPVPVARRRNNSASELLKG
jgi:hypothetical protein